MQTLRTLRIIGSAGFRRAQDQSFTCNNLVLSSMGDLHPFSPSPMFHTENLVLDRCNKNFVYYWLTPNMFPDVKNIYMFSHPCEIGVSQRFNTCLTLPKFHVMQRPAYEADRYFRLYKGEVFYTGQSNIDDYVTFNTDSSDRDLEIT